MFAGKSLSCIYDIQMISGALARALMCQELFEYIVSNDKYAFKVYSTNFDEICAYNNCYALFNGTLWNNHLGIRLLFILVLIQELNPSSFFFISKVTYLI